MILRRLARSIREQDWIAVTIEFLIVVLGIFVGLQVTDWNETRQARDRETALLLQLTEDLASMRGEFTVITDRAGERSARARRAHEALVACDSSIAQAKDFDVVFAQYQNQRTASIVTRTYDEMTASGALARMRDRELSGQIAGLFGGLKTYVEFIDGVRISLPVIDRILWQNVDLGFSASGQPRLDDFDFDAVCRNREVRNAVWEIQDLFYDWETITRTAIEQLDNTRASLDRHLGEEPLP